MFVCDECHDKHFGSDGFLHFSGSYGPCELCGHTKRPIRATLTSASTHSRCARSVVSGSSPCAASTSSSGNGRRRNVDTRTGKIYEIDSIQREEELRKKLREEGGDLVLLDKMPDEKCKRCGGTGSRRTMFSRRYTPCRCTKAFWGKK